MRRLLWMCLLAAIAAAKDHDGGFEQFCLGEHLDSPLDDKDPKERYNSQLGTCTQTFTAVKGIAAADFCRARSPYLLSESKEENSKFKCTWKSNNCGRTWGTYISGKCYMLAMSCTSDYRLMTLKSKSVTRWLSISFNYAALAEVNVAKDSFIEKAVYDHGRIYATTDKKSKTVLLLDRFPVWGYYAGQVVYLQKASRTVQKICEMTPTSTVKGSEQLRPDPGNGRTAAHERIGNSAWCSKRFRSSDSTFSVFSTCSTYQPRLKGADVDLHFFHEVCAAHCPGCYAATEKHVEKCPHVPKGAYYFPAASVAKSASTSCSGNYDATVRLNKQTGFNVLHHPDHTPVMTDATKWGDKRPDNRCADQGRRHVALVKDDLGVFFRDVPINDRLPILCVDGPKMIQVLDPDRCYMNSEPDGNGGCRCKSSFEDALDPKWNLQAYAASQGITKPGYVCIVQKCETLGTMENPPWQYIYFLVDAKTRSRDDFLKVKDFILKMHTAVPNNLCFHVGLFSNRASLSGDYVSPGWDEPAVRNLVERYLTMETYYGDGLSDAFDALERLAAHESTMHTVAGGLVFLITDGFIYDWDRSGEAMQKLRAAKIDLKVVKYGSEQSYRSFTGVVPFRDVFYADNWVNLWKLLKDQLLKEVRCNKIMQEDFDNAARYA